MFRIGEFSLIAQVSARLLRYYDEIGLLSPGYTDPQTGYRYYSASQLPRLNRILVLKELGLGLDQITRLLDEQTSIEEMRGMLTLRKAQIVQAMNEDLARLHLVEARLDEIDTSGHMQGPDVVIKATPAHPYLALREILPDVTAVRGLVSHIAAAVPARISASHLGQIAIVIHSSMFDPDVYDFEVGYLITGKAPASLSLADGRELTLRELPAVEHMATVVHDGRVSDSHRSYGVLGTWVEQQNWQIAGLGRQILMQLPQPNDDHIVVELQLPVITSGATPAPAGG